MKKLIALVFSISLCAALCAQGRIETKKFKISDLPEKTMKVVLTGNDFFDATFKDEIQQVWHISPYEFCTMEEFETLKKSDKYYFLMLTEDKYKKDVSAGIRSLTLFKGDPAAAANVQGLYEVVTIPFCSVGEVGAKAIAFMPALLTIFQEQVSKCMDREFNVGSSVSAGIAKSLRKWNERAVIDAEDFAFPVGVSIKAIYKEENIDILDARGVADCISERTPGCLAGYVVAPPAGHSATVCYTMLINAATWELYYIKQHKISSKAPAGFDQKDVDAIISHKTK